MAAAGRLQVSNKTVRPRNQPQQGWLKAERTILYVGPISAFFMPLRTESRLEGVNATMECLSGCSCRKNVFDSGSVCKEGGQMLPYNVQAYRLE